MSISDLIDKIMEYASNNPEVILNILFSGAGVAVITTIGAAIFKKKKKEKASSKVDNYSNYQVDGYNNVTENNNTIDNRIINFYNSNQMENKKKEKSWFSIRFTKLFELLNESRGLFEKEFTVEFVSSLIGLENVSELKQYILSNARKRRYDYV